MQGGGCSDFQWAPYRLPGARLKLTVPKASEFMPSGVLLLYENAHWERIRLHHL